MKIKLFQIFGFYIRLDVPMDLREEILLGIMSQTGIYSACTDPTLTNCKAFEFNEIKLGIIFLSLSFGIEKLIDQTKIINYNGTEHSPGV